MRLFCFLFITLTVGLAAQEPAQEPAQRAITPPAIAQVDCESCEEGTAKVICVACDGFGKHPCVTCFAWQPSQLRWVDAVVEWLVKDDPVQAFGLRNYTIKPHELDVAKVPCPARKVLGPRAHMLPDGAKCVICKQKGVLNCPDCAREGSYTCLNCSGKGQVSSSCARCAGKGTHPDPRLVEPTPDCTWCDGTALYACLGHSEGTRKFKCDACRGDAKVACQACEGEKYIVCPACAGQGETRATSSRPAKECELCRRASGKLKCPICTGSGTRVCPICTGSKKLLPPCGACYQRLAICRGCTAGRTLLTRGIVAMSPQGDSVKFTDEELSGPIRSWVDAAQAAAKRGDSSAALAWYEQSLVNLKPRLIESFAWNRSLGPRDHAETSDEMRALADQVEASAAEALELQVRRLVNLRIKELKKPQEE